MNFQNLVKIETADTYLDIAFRRAKAKVSTKRKKKRSDDKLENQKNLERIRVDIIKDNLTNFFMKILKSYPSIDDLPPFYNELVKCTLDYPRLKKSLGAINWAHKKVIQFSKAHTGKINGVNHTNDLNRLRNEYYGRISSVVKQINQELMFLEESRKTLKAFPTIKTAIKTFSIVGFPNVGKTTLLHKLTGSKPEINSYPFTTKGINVSYVKIDDEKVQLLDTPGTLNRWNKMNNIEKQAYLSIKYVSEAIIYVFDLTESYPLKDQIKLYKNLKECNKPIIIYLSKSDILDKDVLEEFTKRYKNAITDIDRLKKKLV